jgi:hypothetical protein
MSAAALSFLRSLFGSKRSKRSRFDFVVISAFPPSNRSRTPMPSPFSLGARCMP